MTSRTPALQNFLDEFAKASGLPDTTRAVLEMGSDHPFTCRCEVCRDWWRAMGPDEDADGNLTYGPFTREEIEGEEGAQ